jgi:hypothetical protein
MTSDVVIDALREVYDPCCADRVSRSSTWASPRTAASRAATGGEASSWHPQWTLGEFWNSELPRGIVEERGYPQLTEQAKRKILGGNLARLHGKEMPA